MKMHTLSSLNLRSFAFLALLAFVGLSATACRPESVSVADKPTGPLSLVIPAKGAYTGAYIDFGEQEDTVTLEAIEGFEELVGKRQAIIASSSYWGEQTFPTANVNLIRRHGAIPLLFWSPWDRPYDENMGPDKYSLTSIIAGKWDAYIDAWGDAAHSFGYPLMVSFANEANGNWFPWSGFYYGGEAAAATPGGGFQGPETFKKAYRHVVDRVRARGATNVLWVFHAMNYSIPQDLWNYAKQYYPGAEYVDWLGMSVYGQQFAGERWSPFMPLLEWPYEEICMLDATKPVMLAEWGVGEFPKTGSKARFIKDAFEGMSTKFPRLKAAVFWHERWQNKDETYSNLRVNSSEDALNAYREGVKAPFWLERPVLQPAGRSAGN